MSKSEAQRPRERRASPKVAPDSSWRRGVRRAGPARRRGVLGEDSESADEREAGGEGAADLMKNSPRAASWAGRKRNAMAVRGAAAAGGVG
jgi:hypothetical protein